MIKHYMLFEKDAASVQAVPADFDLYRWYISVTVYIVDKCQINYMYLQNVQF